MRENLSLLCFCKTHVRTLNSNLIEPLGTLAHQSYVRLFSHTFMHAYPPTPDFIQAEWLHTIIRNTREKQRYHSQLLISELSGTSRSVSLDALILALGISLQADRFYGCEGISFNVFIILVFPQGGREGEIRRGLR